MDLLFWNIAYLWTFAHAVLSIFIAPLPKYVTYPNPIEKLKYSIF